MPSRAPTFAPTHETTFDFQMVVQGKKCTIPEDEKAQIAEKFQLALAGTLKVNKKHATATSKCSGAARYLRKLQSARQKSKNEVGRVQDQDQEYRHCASPRWYSLR
jgi:hypothetical protein